MFYMAFMRVYYHVYQSAHYTCLGVVYVDITTCFYRQSVKNKMRKIAHQIADRLRKRYIDKNSI